MTEVEIIEFEFHRNGISGAGFHLVKFRDKEDGKVLMATVPNDRDSLEFTAVFNPLDINDCLRGYDYYGKSLSLAIDKAYGRKEEV